MSLPQDLFEPRHYGAVRRNVLDATTLPPWCYTAPDFFDREVDRIFGRCWNFIGHAGRIPAAGDYFTLEYAGVPLILIRDRKGVLRAFANACRHRGSRLLEGAGNCRAIKCPYHGWIYGLDGELHGTPDMEETRDFDKSDYGLIPVRLESWAGFMFTNFDPCGPSLAEYLGDLPDKLAPYGLADMVCVRRQAYDVACNWKVYVENFMDYYHTPTVHQASLAGANLSEYHREDPVSERGTGEYMLLYGRHEGSAALLEDEPGLPRIATLSGRAARGSSYVCIFPCALIACTIDCVWYVEIHPAGPDRIRLALGACFPKTTASLPAFASRLGPYIRRWDVAVAEDNAINELQQRGISSPFAAAGRVCRLEALSHTFRNWVLDWAIDHPS